MCLYDVWFQKFLLWHNLGKSAVKKVADFKIKIKVYFEFSKYKFLFSFFKLLNWNFWILVCPKCVCMSFCLVWRFWLLCSMCRKMQYDKKICFYQTLWHQNVLKIQQLLLWKDIGWLHKQGLKLCLPWDKIFTSMKTDLCQDINIVSISVGRYFNGTFTFPCKDLLFISWQRLSFKEVCNWTQNMYLVHNQKWIFK